MADPHDEQEALPAPSQVVKNLVSRAEALLSELETLRERLRSLRQEGTVEIAHFRATVQSELAMLKRLAEKPESDATKHVARSSNLPFLETVWATAKKSRDLVALAKRIHFDSGSKAFSQSMRYIGPSQNRKKERGSKEESVIVDAVTDGGLTWTKVSLVTNTRLLFDLAKQGWNSGGSDSEDEDGDGIDLDHRINQNDTYGDVPLVKTAKDLIKAARLFKVHTKQPSVHLVLPRVVVGETAEIDAILENCRKTGVLVFYGENLEPSTVIGDAIHTMAQDPISLLSETLNIDCTILLAIVSDFSHAKVSKEPWFHTALERQVEIEDNENLLPSLLYPTLGSHQLVCTREAAKRMREIVDTIGTPSEKARTAILMCDDDAKPREQLVSGMQQWSAHAVPEHLQLPIKVVDQNDDDCQSRLGEEAKRIGAGMTAINKSVFLYGWATGCTTITSNRTVVKQMENYLDGLVDLDGSAWPKIWLCPTARSLVGKEKRSAKEGRKDGAPLSSEALRGEGDVCTGMNALSMREGHEMDDLTPNGS